jgi:hypothetical protein
MPPVQIKDTTPSNQSQQQAPSVENKTQFVSLLNYYHSDDYTPCVLGYLRKIIHKDDNGEVGSHYFLSLYRETFSKAKVVTLNPNYNFEKIDEPISLEQWSDFGILETKNFFRFKLGQGQVDDGKYQDWFLPFH